jgi:hypothetical protein
LFRIKRPEGLRLSRREAIYLTAYTVVIAAASVLAHEAAHIVAALALGVPFNELRLAFLGINPSVTLPEWFIGTPLTIAYYAGGLTAAVGLFALYLLYWVRKYHRNPSFFYWSLGAVTIALAAMQLATGYLEGRYHAAYIMGAMSLLSVTNILIYGWAVAAIFFHAALCPWQRMKVPVKPGTNTL